MLQVVVTQLRRGGAVGQAFLNSVGHTWPGGVVSGLGGGELRVKGARGSFT
jgi:hypothetical protein